MKTLFYVLIITLFISISISAEEVVYEDFSVPSQYTEVLGNEFPGTNAKFQWTEKGYNSKGALAIDYNFHETGMYCQIKIDYPLNEKKFCFMAKGETDSSLMIRVIDKNGECHQIAFPVNNTDWNKYTVDLNDTKKFKYFGGDNNGTIDLPLQSISIGPQKNKISKGIFYIDDLIFITDNIQKLKKEIGLNNYTNLDFILKTNKPGNLFYTNEQPIAKIAAINNKSKNIDVTLNLKYRDGFGRNVNGGIKSIKLKGYETANIKLPRIKGICEIEYSTQIDGIKKNGIFSYAVINNNNINTMGKSSYFGVNTHFNQGWEPFYGEIVKRAGIPWIRDGEADLTNRALFIAKDNNLFYMPVFTGMHQKSIEYIKSEIKKGKSYKDTWDFTDYITDFGEFAKRYGNDIDVYDTLNEPHNLGWDKAIGGDWAGGEWIGVFYQWATQVSDTIRKNDTNKKSEILWEDMEEFQWSDQYISYGVNKEMDYSSPHPYNLHRDIPLPEKQATLLKYSDFWQRNKDTGRNWGIIVGEVGFSSFTLTDKTPNTFYSPCDRSTQAKFLARMMIMHLSAGVKRIFWYDLRNDGTMPFNQEYNFGLTWLNGNPKPSMAAYANLINLCDGAKWLGQQKYPDTYAYAFLNKKNEYCLALWVTEGEKNISFKTNKKLRIYDLFGNDREIKPQNGKVKININDSPTYIIGLNKSDIK